VKCKMYRQAAGEAKSSPMTTGGQMIVYRSIVASLTATSTERNRALFAWVGSAAALECPSSNVRPFPCS
jgi:hypothetical protein